MSIKNNKPSRKSKFKQGYFKPNNESKYVGPGPIIYRSGWERKFMIWCDMMEDVVQWSSEPVEIPYWDRQTNKKRKYYPDFYFKAKQNDGSYKEYLVEVKPKQQIIKPQPPKKNSTKALKNYKFLAESYLKNMDKYNSARTFCEGRDWHFIILTEDTLGNR